MRNKDRDNRITPANRTIILKIKDYTPVPFTNQDQEWMGEVIEDILQQKFDIEIDEIDIEGNGT